jgi:transglutaminase-like putative cysteine protease
MTLAETQDSRVLEATEFLDHETSTVRRFTGRVLGDQEHTPAEAATLLYYAVRDGIFYDVYDADLSREGLRASSIIERGRGFCVHKSIVYAAACRAAGIPSRLVFADVRNHLASDRLRELVGGTLFCFHTLTAVRPRDRWIKATPVFNKMLCRIYGMPALEFDGESDSLYHPYDADGGRLMEFVSHRGEFDDFPYDLVVGGIRTAHPKLFASRFVTARGSLVAEASPVAGRG